MVADAAQRTGTAPLKRQATTKIEGIGAETLIKRLHEVGPHPGRSHQSRQRLEQGDRGVVVEASIDGRHRHRCGRWMIEQQGQVRLALGRAQVRQQEHDAGAKLTTQQGGFMRVLGGKSPVIGVAQRALQMTSFHDRSSHQQHPMRHPTIRCSATRCATVPPATGLTTTPADGRSGPSWHNRQARLVEDEQVFKILDPRKAPCLIKSRVPLRGRQRRQRV